MNTKILMISSALFMGISGLALQFFPNEILGRVGTTATGIVPSFVQISAAAYLGFAMMNWMAKTVLIGGIYARPMAMGNLVHFMVGALALLRYAFSAPDLWAIWVVAIIYSIFGILFGIVVFTHPGKSKSDPA